MGWLSDGDGGGGESDVVIDSLAVSSDCAKLEEEEDHTSTFGERSIGDS